MFITTLFGKYRLYTLVVLISFRVCKYGTRLTPGTRYIVENSPWIVERRVRTSEIAFKIGTYRIKGKSQRLGGVAKRRTFYNRRVFTCRDWKSRSPPYFRQTAVSVWILKEKKARRKLSTSRAVLSSVSKLFTKGL